MERYSRMVIDLYKKTLMEKDVNHEDILSVRKELECALTEAKILSRPTESLCSLVKDVEDLSNM